MMAKVAAMALKEVPDANAVLRWSTPPSITASSTASTPACCRG
jgi:hypothetical protein